MIEAKNFSTKPSRRSQAGFTLLELIVVIAVVGILASIAMPNFIQTPQRAKEAVLKTNLRTLREVIDQHMGDHGVYPPSLDALVEEGYLRAIPVDPMTDDREWGLIYDQGEGEDFEQPPETELLDGAAGPGIIDIYTLSTDSATNGEAYSEW